jgi:hypothetical protein
MDVFVIMSISSWNALQMQRDTSTEGGYREPNQSVTPSSNPNGSWPAIRSIPVPELHSVPSVSVVRVRPVEHVVVQRTYSNCDFGH